MSLIDQVLDFLKGFVPGYSAIEHLVAPTFGDDENDYGQCRAICGGVPNPTAVITCEKCVNGIFWNGFYKLLPELGGIAAGGVAGLAISIGKEAITQKLLEYLAKKGLTWLVEAGVPFLGWVFLIGEIANVIMLFVTLGKMIKASDAAKAKLCVCP